jgi:hypothetical protein
MRRSPAASGPEITAPRLNCADGIVLVGDAARSPHACDGGGRNGTRMFSRPGPLSTNAR